MRRIRVLRSAARVLAKGLLVFTVIVLVLVALGLSILETGWAKNQIRALIVRQANQYLTATLDIGRLEGSLLRGIQLGDIRLARDGQPIVSIDDVSLTYSLRELFQQGVVIRRIRLARPRVFVARQPDGRWNVAALIKRDAREEERTGPKRPIQILSIEVMDATVSLADPLKFGAAYVPTRFNALNATFSFDYVPVRWRLNFSDAAWIGLAPDLTVTHFQGGIGRGPGGWTFDDLVVRTPRTSFTFAGRVERSDAPTTLDLHVRADRFDFQEWAGVLQGLKNIAVSASFDTQLKGPLTHLDTNLRLTGTGGAVTGALVLDTTVPGWHGSGVVDVDRLNLARWLNRPDRPSDISGRVSFDLALELGRRFPRGTYSFTGRHAAFLGYEADNVRARGHITATEALIAEATAVAYGAQVGSTSGSIAINAPYPFRFRGQIAGLDLRRVPPSVPVPHVESVLAFDYDVSGRFSRPFITAGAVFAPSQFLGAALRAGSTGTIDTAAKPLTFSGEGDIDGIDLSRFGKELAIGWLQDPRYAGVVSGRFHVQGSGTDRDSLLLTGGGTLARADLFGGTLSDAGVTIEIDHGTLRSSFNGRFANIHPEIPFADRRFAASLTGFADVRATVRDLLKRSPELSDYDIEGSVALQPSAVRGIQVDTATFDGRLDGAIATLRRVDISGPAIEGHGSGTLSFLEERPSDFAYDVVRADLAALTPAVVGHGRQRVPTEGMLATAGRWTGPWSAVRLAGHATVTHLAASGINALTMNGEYDVIAPFGQVARATARVTGQASFITVLGTEIPQASGTLTFAGERLAFDVQLTQKGRTGVLNGTVLVHPDRREIVLTDLTATLGRALWRLAPADPPPTVAWNDDGVTISPLLFLGGTVGDERIAVSGTWRTDGQGALRVTATHVFLDTLDGASEQPARYGGTLDFDGTIRGSRERPIVTGRLTITEGRFERFSYQKLAGRLDYTDGLFDVDLRLDQSAGVWITAAGTVPLALFDRKLPERPIDAVITSSAIGLGLVEGVTDVVRNVTGELLINTKVIGTSHDPHFQGTLNIADAAFHVPLTGARYKNGRADLTLATDRITVNALHLEDSDGGPLEVRGSLGTHELAVGELEIDAQAQDFEIVRNEFGRLTVDAALTLRGRFEMPRLGGDITINSGDLNVDEILDRTLFQPYATEPVSITDVDAVAALNPWDRLSLDVTLHVPRNLKLSGDSVQVSPGTPIGLGDVNLRVGGDLSLYKDPGQRLSVTGSLDAISGTYTFQGRRFEVDEAVSSINFRGDLNPEISISVTRQIAAVLTRVTIAGELRNPSLQLASTPPLDPSDILSLIVFNTSTNELSAAQQQELAVRGATLAAGFLATPIVSAIESQLGLESLTVEPGGALGTGARVTVGEEIAPGLIARFSRQFGPEPYDEATIEYYLSRLFRLRATFSDAASLNTRSPFRRIERAGIDLLMFFSF